MLKDQSVVERRRSLCLALLKSHLTEWIDSADGMEFGMSLICYNSEFSCVAMRWLSVKYTYVMPLWVCHAP